MRRISNQVTRIVYQCTDCGRLLINREDGGLGVFNKVDPYIGMRTLGSVFDDAWKRQ